MPHKHNDECKGLSLKCAIPENHRHNHKCRGYLDSVTKNESLLCWTPENHKHDKKKCYLEVYKCGKG
jgi:hypothetical protein